MSREVGAFKRPRSPERPARPTRPRYVLIVAAGFALSLAYLWGRNQTLVAWSRIESLNRSKEALQRTVDRLELDMIALRSSDRIVAMARERLDLDFPVQPIPTLAVVPEAANRGPSVWTYMENAFVIAVEGMQRRLSPTARAHEIAADPDTTGGT